jgi:hypothetical protein
MKPYSSFLSLCRLVVALFAALPSLAFAMAGDAQDPVMRAMRDELARSMAQLQLENLEKPYFISYRVQESRSQNVGAQFGSALGRNESRNRFVVVEVRVGSPALDNTNFQPAGFGSGPIGANLPTDDDYDAIRRQLWLATDRAYKQSVELLSKKKAVLQNKTRTEIIPDFSAQEPATITDLNPGAPIDLTQAEPLVCELSSVFREFPGVATSSVRVGAIEETTRYVNSEGTSFVRSGLVVILRATAATQADDGFPLDDHFFTVARSWATLPSKADLLVSVRELGRRVTAQRTAGLLEQYNGPVLFEGQAAAEIFAQVIAPNFCARPRPVVETSSRGGPRSGGPAENPFLDKLGARVLPDFFTVTDNPTLTSLNGAPLFGESRVDDEGVPSRPVTLVEKGRLKTLLASRAPVRGVPRSTGSVQEGNPSPSNLIVTAADGLDAAALKAELLKLLEQRGKDYGVIVRRLANGSLGSGASPGGRGNSRAEPVLVAVKVFPDGREEPLRNIEVAGIDPPSFKDILVAGREPYINTVPFQGIICSFAVPSLLFEDLTLEKPSGEIGKPPIAKHPFFDR